MKQISLTGIKPTGMIHIGNFFGAIKPAIEMNKDGEFDNLNEVINNVYLVKEDDTEIRYLIAQSILKANPELAKYVTAGVVDYTNGDVIIKTTEGILYSI